MKHVSDLIDRQQAIDAVAKWFYDVFGITESDGTATIFKRLRELPSAQPHWIPCSERLPEEEEDVLVCSEDGCIDVACWMYEEWSDEPNIEWWSGEYRVDAVAWMPLPELYGGRER